MPEDPWLPSPTPDPFEPGHDGPPVVPVQQVARRSRLALILGLGSLPVTVVFFPAGIALSVAALILGIRARRAATAAGVPKRPATVAVVTGSIALALGILLTAVVITFWSELRAYETCISGANTHQSTSECNKQLSESLDHRFGIR